MCEIKIWNSEIFLLRISIKPSWSEKGTEEESLSHDDPLSDQIVHIDFFFFRYHAIRGVTVYPNKYCLICFWRMDLRRSFGSQFNRIISKVTKDSIYPDTRKYNHSDPRHVRKYSSVWERLILHISFIIRDIATSRIELIAYYRLPFIFTSRLI